MKKGLRPATVHKEGEPQKMPVFRLFTLGEWSEPQILEAAANLGGIPGCTRGPLLCSPWRPIIAIVRAITRDLVLLAAAFCP